MPTQRSIDYRYAASNVVAKRPRFPGHRLTVPLVEACLEAGMTSGDAVRFAIDVYWELDRLSRVEDGGKNLPAFADMRVIRQFAIAVLRSGTGCDKPFLVASRAVGTWREMKEAARDLRKVWDAEDEGGKRRTSKTKQTNAAGTEGRKRGRPRKVQTTDPETGTWLINPT